MGSPTWSRAWVAIARRSWRHSIPKAAPMPKARRSRPGLVITTTNIIITTITAMGMRMAESALYDLLSWMSPSYPIGAFAHSSGLEWEVEAGHAHAQIGRAHV